MKIKHLVFSALALSAISTSAISATAEQTYAATTNTTTTQALDVDMYASSDTLVYNAPNGASTTQTLKTGTAWHVSGSRTINGQIWYQVGLNQWVKGDTFSINPTATAVSTTMYVTATYGAAVCDTPYAGFKRTGQVLKKNSAWHVTGQVTVSGTTWYQVGANQWVWGPDMSANKPVTQAPEHTMTATAYDPRVLGNTTFGYDTVAANLSVYPRGTKLAITFANGTTKNYVVRDTGTFAYSNPNQLDIAMPNSQALQFGRQSVTVRVITD